MKNIECIKYVNHGNQTNHRMSLQQPENQENPWITFENHANHENPKDPCEN